MSLFNLFNKQKKSPDGRELKPFEYLFLVRRVPGELEVDFDPEGVIKDIRKLDKKYRNANIVLPDMWDNFPYPGELYSLCLWYFQAATNPNVSSISINSSQFDTAIKCAEAAGRQWVGKPIDVFDLMQSNMTKFLYDPIPVENREEHFAEKVARYVGEDIKDYASYLVRTHKFDNKLYIGQYYEAIVEDISPCPESCDGLGLVYFKGYRLACGWLD